MMMRARGFCGLAFLTVILGMAGCGGSTDSEVRMESMRTGPSFEDDLDFLREHKEVIVLSDESGQAQVAVVPDYQGRVMTSTAQGPAGASFGWLNRELIASGEFRPHMNAFGGEDRFWMGPEGGQFAICFAAGDPFDLEHWQTPAVIDTVSYQVVSHDDRQVTFRHQAEVVNYSETRFSIQIDRVIELLDRRAVSSLIGGVGQNVAMVAYQSTNTITNQGPNDWTREDGLLSIWILGVFRHSPTMTVVIPYLEGAEEELGPVVNDAYFGKVPEDRLVVGRSHIFFKADGAFRSKIGMLPQRSKGISGSYDSKAGVLTIVHFSQPPEARDYVNSMWELQDEPYRGDAINSYNDGPPSPGAPPLGPFYEIETSSPAALLVAGESITHTHTTIHFVGSVPDLDPIVQQTLGINITSIRHVFDED